MAQNILVSTKTDDQTLDSAEQAAMTLVQLPQQTESDNRMIQIPGAVQNMENRVYQIAVTDQLIEVNQPEVTQYNLQQMMGVTIVSYFYQSFYL